MEPIDGRILQAPHGAFFSSLPPAAAGALRGVTLAVVLAILKGAVDYLAGGNVVPAGWDIYVPLMLAFLRSLEGVVDQLSVNKAANVLAKRQFR